MSPWHCTLGLARDVKTNETKCNSSKYSLSLITLSLCMYDKSQPLLLELYVIIGLCNVSSTSAQHNQSLSTQPDLNTDSRACFILCFSFQNFQSWDFLHIIWCWNLSCLDGINVKISLEWSFPIVEFRVDVWVYRVLVFHRSVISKNDKFITPTLTHHKCKNDTSKWFLLVMIHFVIGMPLMMNTSIYDIYFLFYHSQKVKSWEKKLKW